MPADALYDDIVRALRDTALDDKVFERVAVRVANYAGVRVLPMPGGQDGGYDGAIVDQQGERQPGVLAVTLQQDGLGNLRKNLKTHSDNFPDAAKTAFFVTSRAKSNPQKKNLTEAAAAAGYALQGIADESVVAEFLYYNPDSCMELLGFKGVPAALSTLPPRRRQHWDVELVAREEPLAKLKTAPRDSLLVGIPGSGKTSLLSQMAAEGLGLFARTSSREALAPEIRAKRPATVFVDGLDDQFAAVQSLVSIREESGLEFRIVATGWSEDEGVVELLGLGPDDRVSLERLGLDELVEVVQRVGLAGPRELIHSIVRQAGGSPGLAVTLTMACREGNVGEVVTGAILLRQVRMSLAALPLDAKRAEMALAAMSVGGDEGMRPSDVAVYAGMAPLELSMLLADIDAGGVIRPSGQDRISVQPELLRGALVACHFYGPYPVATQPLLDVAPYRPSALRTLVLAAHLGTEPDELRFQVAEQGPEVLDHYASLGPSQCEWVLKNHPEALGLVARVALHHSPDVVLPMLIAAARGDERALNNTLEHPLRIISDWCQGAEPGEGEAVARRDKVVSAALAYLAETDDVDTVVAAMAQALTTEYDSGYSDPGRGMSFTMVWSILTPEEIAGVVALWERCFDALKARPGLPWRRLLSLARNANGARPLKDETLVAESRKAAGEFRDKVGCDLFSLGRDNPAVAASIRDIVSEDAGLTVPTEEERTYALLFERTLSRDWEAAEASVTSELTSRADEWSVMAPRDVLDVLSNLGAAAAEVRENGLDRRPFALHLLAEKAPPLEWLDAALDRDLDYTLVAQFAKRAAALGAGDWGPAVKRCLGTPSEAAAVEVALSTGDDCGFLSDVIPLLPKYVGLVETMCIRREVLDSVLPLLFDHSDATVASEAAINHWHGVSGSVAPELRSSWREAILRSTEHASWMGDLLASDASLAFEWLRRRMASDDWRTLMEPHVVKDAVAPLTTEQRAELLCTIRESWRYSDVVRLLFGDSIEAFSAAADRGASPEVLLVGLERTNDEVWAERVLACAKAGITMDDIAHSSAWLHSWSGPESERLQERIAAVAPFLEDGRPVLRDVAERMTRVLNERRDRALVREHEERVWGR